MPCSSGSNISPSTFSIASLQSSDWFVTINVYFSVVPSCAVTFIFTSALSVFFGIVALAVPVTSILLSICTFAFESSGITYSSNDVAFLFTRASYWFTGTASAAFPSTFTLSKFTLSGSAFIINVYVFVVPSSAVTGMFTTIHFPSSFIFLYVAPSSCSFVFIPTFVFVSSAIAPIVIVSTFLSNVYSYVFSAILLISALFPSTVTSFRFVLLFSL